VAAQDLMVQHLAAMAKLVAQAAVQVFLVALAVRLDQAQPIKVMLVAQRQVAHLRTQVAVAAQVQSEQMQFLAMAVMAAMVLLHL
jgi:hypothetical protein